MTRLLRTDLRRGKAPLQLGKQNNFSTDLMAGVLRGWEGEGRRVSASERKADRYLSQPEKAGNILN